MDFNKIKAMGLEYAEKGKNVAMDLAEKGKTQALLVNEQGKLLKAQRQLGALVYSLAKGKEENQPLVDKYIDTSQGPNGQTMYSYKGRAVDPQTIFEDASLVFDQSEGTFTSISSANSPAAKTINLNLSVLNTQDASINGSNFSNIEVDFSKSMNYNNNGTSTIGGMNGDLQGDGKGKALGALTGITVSDDGKIYGSYDNGNTVILCQIAVAQFANASGLEKIGDDCYQSTLNSGEFDGIGVEISADGGSISSGELEMSNVDLSSQFTDMIVTQRGFQANSRVITTSDTLLEELINLKR